MSALLEAAQALLAELDPHPWSDSLREAIVNVRSAIAEAEKAPAVVSADEINGLLNPLVRTPSDAAEARRISALVAERTAVAVAAAVARERQGHIADCDYCHAECSVRWFDGLPWCGNCGEVMDRASIRARTSASESTQDKVVRALSQVPPGSSAAKRIAILIAQERSTRLDEQRKDPEGRAAYREEIGRRLAEEREECALIADRELCASANAALRSLGPSGGGDISVRSHHEECAGMGHRIAAAIRARAPTSDGAKDSTTEGAAVGPPVMSQDACAKAGSDSRPSASGPDETVLGAVSPDAEWIVAEIAEEIGHCTHVLSVIAAAERIAARLRAREVAVECLRRERDEALAELALLRAENAVRADLATMREAKVQALVEAAEAILPPDAASRSTWQSLRAALDAVKGAKP